MENGSANDTGRKTESGGKGGIEGLKEEAENPGKSMESLSTENLKGEVRNEVGDLRATEGMKATAGMMGKATKGTGEVMRADKD